MTAPGRVRPAIERAALYFSGRGTRQGIVARKALRRPAPEDEALTRRLIEEMLAQSARDGNAVVPRVWLVHELMDLGCDEADGACRQILDWLLRLQEKPGAFSEGCSPIRHAHRVCQHFISGFFSPAPPEQRVAPLMLPNGKMFRAEPAARFAVSCLALRAALRARFEEVPAVAQHLAALRQMQEQWHDWNGYFAPDLIVAGIHALALAGTSTGNARAQLGEIILVHQGEDGSWPQADLFHTLEALMALATREAHVAVQRAVPALLARQRLDGSFGSTAQQERSLIALRVLLWAEQDG